MLYHVPNRLLLQKFLITRNKKYSGMISSGGKNARTSEGFLNTFKLDEFEGDGNILENKWEKRKSKVCSFSDPSYSNDLALAGCSSWILLEQK